MEIEPFGFDCATRSLGSGPTKPDRGFTSFEFCAQGCQFQGFKVWDPGDFWVLGFGGTAALEVQVGNSKMFRALPKLNPRFLCLLDLGQFKFLFKNKHDQICRFRLWFYFLFLWVLFELSWIYWIQWQYLPAFFC